MSGIYGLVCRPGDSIAARSAAALSRLPHRALSREMRWHDNAGATMLASLWPEWQGVRDSAFERDGSCIVVDGFVQRRSDAHAPWCVSTAADLLGAVEADGLGALDNVKGSFNAAIWQASQQRLLLFNDPVGHRLVFYACGHEQLVFGSNVHFVVESRERAPAVSLAGLSELVNYGFILGEQTLFEGIEVLGPGSVLVFERGTARITRYWHTNDVAPARRYDEDLVDELSETLVSAMAEPIAHAGKDIAVSLTGGLDSRCVYAAARATDPAILAHTAGQPDSTDVVIARDIAALSQGRHLLEIIEPGNLSTLLAPMVYLQGGLMATLHCHPVQLIAHDLPVHRLVQGVGGEFCRGADWVDYSDLGRHVDPQFIESRLLVPNARRLDQRKLWVNGLDAAQSAIRVERLSNLLRLYENGDDPVSVLKTLSLYDLSRKFLNKSGMIVNTNREIHYPYLDLDWVRLVAAIPIADRLANDLQLDVLRRLDERLVGVVYAKTLLPMNAGRWRVAALKRYRDFLQKAGRRLGRSPQFSVPNHQYRRWIRHEMSPAIAAIVLRDNAHYAQYLDRDFIHAVYGEHMSGARNWESLLSAVVVLEIACMLWIEKNTEAMDALAWFDMAASMQLRTE